MNPDPKDRTCELCGGCEGDLIYELEPGEPGEAAEVAEAEARANPAEVEAMVNRVDVEATERLLIPRYVCRDCENRRRRRSAIHAIEQRGLDFDEEWPLYSTYCDGLTKIGISLANGSPADAPPKVTLPPSRFHDVARMAIEAGGGRFLGHNPEGKWIICPSPAYIHDEDDGRGPARR